MGEVMDGRIGKPEVKGFLKTVLVFDGTNLRHRVRSVSAAFELLDYVSQGDAAELLRGRLFDALGHWLIDLNRLSVKAKAQARKGE